MPPVTHAGELRALLDAAVRRCVQGDALACNLSGGLDSSVIAALAARAGAAVTAYTMVDDFVDDGEAERARAMARRVGARHVELRVRDAELPGHAEAAIRAGGVPIVNGRAVASWLFYRGIAGDLASASHGAPRAVATGVGADEVFCGDPARLDPGPGGVPPWLARLHDEGWPGAPARVSSIDDSERAFLDLVFPALTLPMETRMAAAHGVDVRFPYLDPALRAALSPLPVAVRAPRGEGKAILRAIAADLVPDEIRLARKLPRYAPAGGGSPAARAAWRAFYERWVPARHRALLARWGAGDPPEALDRRLLRLASEEILR
jgi:asparagine synthase (glutamine-hydrolysing)